MNPSSGFLPASPPGRPVVSNLYPTQSPVASHNGHFEPLQASMTSPPSEFQRALNVAPVETERFLPQIAQPHFSNNPSVSSFPQAQSSYNAYPTLDYHNYFITLPHEPSRDFGFGFNPYRPHPGTCYPLPHNNHAVHNNILPRGHLFPQSNPMHNFQQQYRPPGFLPIEYGPTGIIHRSFYPSPPHIVPSLPIAHQATLRGNGATFVTSDCNMQVCLIVSSWYSLKMSLNPQDKDHPPGRPFLPRYLNANSSPRVKANKPSQQLSRLESGQPSSSGGSRQTRRINNLSPSTRSSLLEEFRTNRDKRWTIKVSVLLLFLA